MLIYFFCLPLYRECTLLGTCRLSWVRSQYLRARYAQTRGEGGTRKKRLRGRACKIILVRNLLRQAKAHSRVQFWIPVPQGTGEAISADHAGVRPRGRDCNLLETDSIKRDSSGSGEPQKETKDILEDENNKQVCTSTGDPLKKKEILRDQNDKQVGTSTWEPLKKKEVFRDKKGKNVRTYTVVVSIWKLSN